MNAEAVLLAAYAESHPSDLARACETLDAAGAAAALGDVPPDAAVRVFPVMSPPAAARVLAALTDDTAAVILPVLPVDLLTNLLRRLDGEAADRLLATMPAGAAAAVRRQLASPDGTAGALMDPTAAVINVEAGVAEAQAIVREGLAAVDAIYVVDDSHAVVGLVDTGVLALATSDGPIRTLLRPAPPPVPIGLPLATVVALPEWQSVDALPVVDEQKRFAGVLQHRRLRQAAAPAPGSDRTMRTLMALGEVYWLGLSGLMQGLATSATVQSSREAGGRS